MVGHVVRVWVYQGLYGLRSVGNIWGGVWVVLKLEWQPLHEGAPPVKSCRVRSSFGPASSSSFPPSCPLGRHDGFMLLVQPHHHLGFFGSSGTFCFSFSPITSSPPWLLDSPKMEAKKALLVRGPWDETPGSPGLSFNFNRSQSFPSP